MKNHFHGAALIMNGYRLKNRFVIPRITRFKRWEPPCSETG